MKVSPAKDSDDLQLHAPRMAGKRKCRDIIFLIIFLAYWVAMIIVAIMAVNNGSPAKLLAPVDSYGNVCGYNNTGLASTTNIYYDQTANPYLYYFNPYTLTAGTYICVPNCPTTFQLKTYSSTAVTNGTYGCQPPIPVQSAGLEFCRYDSYTTSATQFASNLLNGTCTPFVYPSSSILGRCSPVSLSNLTSIINAIGSTNGTSQVTSAGASAVTAGTTQTVQVVGSIVSTWQVIVVCISASVIISMLWLVMMQYLANFFVWLTLLVANLAFIFTTVWLYFYWQCQLALSTSATYPSPANAGITTFINTFGISSLNPVTTQDVTYLQIVFYVSAACTAIMILITIAMIKRLKIAVAVIGQASHAMMKMPAIVLFPFNAFVCMGALFAYFIVILLYIMSPVSVSSSVSLGINVSTSAVVSGVQNTEYIELAIHVLGFLWTLYLIMAINQITIAGAFASWYWSVDKHRVMILPVTAAFLRTMSYHIGSACCGALLIAIVQLIRLILYTIQSKVAKSKMPMMKYIVACALCCMSCVAGIVKFINGHAYIMIAVSGQAFFASAAHATGLLIKHAAKMVAVDFVSTFVLALSKLIVAAICGLGCYIYILLNSSTYAAVTYPQVSVALVALGSFLIASAFFSVYETAVQTIFLCFLEDIDQNDGSSAKPYFMPEGLAKIMGVESVSSPKKGGSPSRETQKQIHI